MTGDASAASEGEAATYRVPDIIDAPAQISSIIFVSLFPRLLERGGWPAMFRMCAGCSVGGLGFMWLFMRMEARNPSADLQLP